MNDIQKELRKYASPQKAKILQGFFKTGPGEYGEGDVFIGVQVPFVRQVAKKFQDVSLKEATCLLKSPIHEERELALFILVFQFLRSDEKEREIIYKAYLKNTRYINNWDLVDLSAEKIIGPFLADKSKAPLIRLARSLSLWERRIAILSTFYFIKNYEFKETLKIAKILIGDPEDLIHKAVGWMLREVGKRDQASEEKFLKKYYEKMPRTMLRYAIERFSFARRKAYLEGRV
ncbi:MAG: DNA alkylation repair protein [Candidatus Omnitrophota bacterium]